MALFSSGRSKCVRCLTIPKLMCSGSLWVRRRKLSCRPEQSSTCPSFILLTRSSYQKNWLTWSGRQRIDAAKLRLDGQSLSGGRATIPLPEDRQPTTAALLETPARRFLRLVAERRKDGSVSLLHACR